MAAQDVHHDRDDPAPPPPRKVSLPSWVAALLLLGSILVIGLGVAGAVTHWLGSRDSKVEDTSSKGPSSLPVRDETGAFNPADLRRYLVGKSPEEALDFFGEPLREVTAGQLSIYIFTCSTRDPVTEDTDTQVSVTCHFGRVSNVSAGAADTNAEIPPFVRRRR